MRLAIFAGLALALCACENQPEEPDNGTVLPPCCAESSGSSDQTDVPEVMTEEEFRRRYPEAG